MKAKRKRSIGAIPLGIITVLGAGMELVRAAFELPSQAHALWRAGDLVVAHLRLNPNAWRRNWSELAPTYRTLERNPPSPVPSTCEGIRSRAIIAWNAEIGDLAAALFMDDFRPFRVRRRLNGRGTHYAGTEPNAAVWTYLQSVSNAVVGRRV